MFRLMRKVLQAISTHTLRGERDSEYTSQTRLDIDFISTHTLRGERDSHRFAILKIA